MKTLDFLNELFNHASARHPPPANRGAPKCTGMGGAEPAFGSLSTAYWAISCINVGKSYTTLEADTFLEYVEEKRNHRGAAR